MVWTDTFQSWPQPIAGATMVVLAVWLLYLNFNHRLHRMLALFLVARAMTNFLQPFVNRTETAGFGDRLYPYFIIFQFFAGVYLAYAYRQQFSGRVVRAWVGASAVLACLALEMLYVADHGLWGTGSQPGPLAVFRPLRIAVYIAIALLFILEYGGFEPGPRRRALFLASMGFALDAVYLTVLFAAGEFGFDPGRFGQGEALQRAVRVLMVAACLSLLGVLAWQARAGTDQNAKRLARTYLEVLAVVILTGLVTIAVGSREPARLTSVYNVFDGLWTLAFPTLFAYAILRHRLFGIEVQARRAIRRSTLAAVFLLILFIVAQLTESYAERFVGQFGWLLGAVAAGALLFALEPLQRWTRRVAEAAVPSTATTSTGGALDPREVYREAARIAWADGMLDRSERAILDGLASRLGLNVDETVRIEREASRA